MTPPVSVVVVSRGRPHLLRLTLLSLYQQDHPELEVVVVADALGVLAAERLPFAHRLKVHRFDEANISAARNTGIAMASGEVIAFIDDDAVAEPTWARRLAMAFIRPDVVAATGYVRGRNGISFQWRATTVGADGVETPLQVNGPAAFLRARPGLGVKTVGTNCAFRREALERVGGFDRRYRYFLDETDLNLRLASHSDITAVVPDAQVMHGFAASANRRADRAPTDLTEIGASVAVFLGEHCLSERVDAALGRFREEQWRRAERHLVSGGLEPRDMRRLLRSFELGVAEGRRRSPRPGLPHATTPDFLPIRPEGPPARHEVLAHRPWHHAAVQQALSAAEASDVRSLFVLWPGWVNHRVLYVEPGVWLQRGGQCGRSVRHDSPPRWAGFRRRVADEAARIDAIRRPGTTIPPYDAAVQQI